MSAEELPPERLLTRPEVEHHFGISKRWLEIAAVKGSGPPFAKIGTRCKYCVADLRVWIALRTRRSTSDPGPDLLPYRSNGR